MIHTNPLGKEPVMADKGSSSKGSAPKPGSGNIGNIGPKLPPDDMKPIR